MYLNLPEFTWIYLSLPKFTWINLSLPEFTWIYPEFTLPKKRGYYAVLAHFSRFLVSSSNLGNWISVCTQFGHGRTRLSVRAHFGYGRTNLKKSLFFNRFFCQKKCFPFSFPILGGRDSTTALQSTQFQNPGVPWVWWTKSGGRKSLCLIVDAPYFGSIDVWGYILISMRLKKKGKPKIFCLSTLKNTQKTKKYLNDFFGKSAVCK